MNCRTIVSLGGSCRRSRGFSLIEAMVSLSIVGVAGSALLLGTYSSIQGTQDTLERTIAAGMAKQLLDEVAGKRYMSVGVNPYQIPFSPSAYEMGGVGRERYDDIDDYHGFSATPPRNPGHVRLGEDDGTSGTRHVNFRVPSGYFDNWWQLMEMYYVSDSNPSVRLYGNQTSNHRAIEIRILRVEPGRAARELANVREVFAYVPVP